MKLFKCSTNSLSRNPIAFLKSLASIASATCFVNLTASINGLLQILFSIIPIIGDGVSGVDSKTALTASTPCKVANIRS